MGPQRQIGSGGRLLLSLRDQIGTAVPSLRQCASVDYVQGMCWLSRTVPKSLGRPT
jgi:hypothetical protein